MLKVVELFAGIGAFRQAMKNLNIPHEMVGFSEIDKYAVEAYRAVHDDYITPNLGDITKIEELPSCDLLTYGFPCQDLSIAGHGKGIKEGKKFQTLLGVTGSRKNLYYGKYNWKSTKTNFGFST